ncbi:hypothetical protein D3C73_1289950 [compost metagenome]
MYLMKFKSLKLFILTIIVLSDTPYNPLTEFSFPALAPTRATKIESPLYSGLLQLPIIPVEPYKGYSPEFRVLVFPEPIYRACSPKEDIVQSSGI